MKKNYGVLDTISKTIYFYGPSKIISIFSRKLIFLTQRSFSQHLWKLPKKQLRSKNYSWKKLWCFGYHIHDHRLLWAIQHHQAFLCNFLFCHQKTFPNTKKRLQTSHQKSCGRFRKTIFLTRQHHCFLMLYGSFWFFNFDDILICCILWIGKKAIQAAENI